MFDTFKDDLKRPLQSVSAKALLLAIIFAAAAFYLVRRIQKQITDARFAKDHKCHAPLRLETRWPLGVDLLWQAFKYARSGHILQFFTRVVERTGHTFEQNLLGVSGIDTVDPRNLEAVLSTQFNEFGLGDRRPCFAPLLGDGIFTQEGRPWKHSREILRPLFSANRVSNFMQIREHVERLISCIPENEVVDFQSLFFRFTLDTTTYLLFGQSINSLESENPQTTAFAESFRIAQDYLARRGRLGGLYWLIGGKEFRQACSTVHDFVDSAIQAALSAEPAPKSEAKSVYTFLDILIQETRDPRILRDQLLNLLLAGRDTTACCLTWAFRLLVQHQDVFIKLRNEIESIVGVGQNARHPDRLDLKKMTYLGFFLKEVLRLYPSVPINSRTSLHTTTLPVGGGRDGASPILLKKGQAVGYCVYAMHRRTDIYGADAKQFRPERWDPNNGNNEVSLQNIGWGYLPFNGGPRVCLGQEFALLEVSYVVVRLLQSFKEFDYGPAQQIVDIGKERQDVTLVLASVDGCRIRVHS